MSSQLKRLAVIGECMLEFYHVNEENFHLGFAGDVFNMAYYFAQLAEAGMTVDMITALGRDPYSQKMIKTWASYGVRGHLTRFIDDKLPGLYLVETDEYGERDFIYYRENAAARYMFEGTDGVALLNQLSTFDVIYFSGITLAILKEPYREGFLNRLRELKQAGVKIVFDCNYRARLWPSIEVAQACVNLVIPFVDIALPSFGDSNLLFGDHTLGDCVNRYLSAGVSKVIASEGEKGYMIATPESQQYYNIEGVKPVDTTGAGDSFSGAYVAGMMAGMDDVSACERASKLSREVVKHKGAIVSREKLGL